MGRGPGGLRESLRERRSALRDRTRFRLVSRSGARVVSAEMLRDSRKRAMTALPSLFTLANMLCGFSAMLTAIDGNYRTAAVFIGVSIILDIVDGAVARAVGSITPFGLQFDSLADLVSFGVAPAVLAFTWAMHSLGPLGWVACFAWLAGAAIRLARFNVTIDPMADKRFFIGLPSPGAAGVVIATVFAFPGPLSFEGQLLALAVMVIPGLLMVTSFRFRSFRSLITGGPYPLIAFAVVLAVGLSTVPAITGLVVAYGYVALPLLGWITAPIRHRIFGDEAAPVVVADPDDDELVDDLDCSAVELDAELDADGPSDRS